jgi:hypothetical protein
MQKGDVGRGFAAQLVTLGVIDAESRRAREFPRVDPIQLRPKICSSVVENP